jgi:undecaprenyl diphosphate synthase
VKQEHPNIPHHVAIVMDGNGRWATKRMLPRIMGHRAGAKAVRRAIDFCIRHRINTLSLFALSVENFLSRPQKEVDFLLELFKYSLERNIAEMHQNKIRIRFVGDLSVFSASLQNQLQEAVVLTQHNTGLNLVLAVNYSGRWDVFQAAQQFSQHILDHHLDPKQLTENDFSRFLSLRDLPEPDLMIRTSGEKRISNFMLWQLAYTELCFVEEYWPDFDEHIFSRVIEDFQKRERRFGKVVGVGA